MRPSRLLLAATFLALAPFAFAIDAGDVVRAQKVLTAVLKITSKYQAMSVNVPAPTPLTDATGKYFVPYNAKGDATEWATKAFNAQAGAAVGAKVGEKAAGALAAKVPLGGLLAGVAKNKGKSLGAFAAVGGADFVKKTSDFSFKNLDDYIVYLHVTHSGSPGYAQTLATVMSIYPEVEKNYNSALQRAYQGASKKAKVAAK